MEDGLGAMVVRWWRSSLSSLDWRELAAAALLGAFSLWVLATAREMAYAFYSYGAELGGWQATTNDVLGYLPRNFTLPTDAVPFLALVLVGWHRSSQATVGEGDPKLHLRHFRVAGWTELLFWIVVICGVATVADVAVVSSTGTSGDDAWLIIGGVLEGLAILLVGWAGILVSKRLTRQWITTHVAARGGLTPTGLPAGT